MILLRDIEVGLVPDQMAIRAEVPGGGSLGEFPPGTSDGGLAQEQMLPEVVRQQVLGDRLDEDAVVYPYQVQARIFRDQYLAHFDSLAMKRFDVRAGLRCHDP